MDMYPLKFQPIFKERIWGGQKLRSYFEKDFPVGTKIGESWELADLPDDKSKVVNGSLSGETIDKVMSRFSDKITGTVNYKPPFVLLIKILDAQDILSVQVHPDKETCLRRGKGNPKTECWYIIDADKDAVIYKGLKPGVTKENFKAAIKEGSCAELLNKVAVKQGECHFLPAGTAHAIGAGLLIAEIQTPSDTTYRVFDWNRIDENGQGRQLHIEDALESINFNQSEETLTVKSIGRLVDSEVFNVDKGHQLTNGEVLLSSGVMRVLIFISGSGKIIWQQKEKVDFVKGDTVLIPAEFEGVMIFDEDTEYLTVTA